jgi:hypothetical protein
VLIEFLRPHGVYRPGQTTDQIEGGVADVLFRRGIARPAGQPAPAPPPAAPAANGAPPKPKPPKPRG